MYLIKIENEEGDVDTERDEPKDQIPRHFFNRSASVEKFQNWKLDLLMLWAISEVQCSWEFQL